jgi:hypothetical protein
MYPIEKCQKIWNFYLWESNKERSVWYLKLEPHTSLDIHNRLWWIENLIQVEWECVMIVFDNDTWTNYKLLEWDKLSIKPEWTWHIHSNPFEKDSLTYWYFDWDIRDVINKIRLKK